MADDIYLDIVLKGGDKVKNELKSATDEVTKLKNGAASVGGEFVKIYGLAQAIPLSIQGAGKAFDALGIKLDDQTKKTIKSTFEMSNLGKQMGMVFGPAGAIIGGALGAALGVVFDQAARARAEFEKMVETTAKIAANSQKTVKEWSQINGILTEAQSKQAELTLSENKRQMVEMTQFLEQAKRSLAIEESKNMTGGGSSVMKMMMSGRLKTARNRVDLAQERINELSASTNAILLAQRRSSAEMMEQMRYQSRMATANAIATRMNSNWQRPLYEYNDPVRDGREKYRSMGQGDLSKIGLFRDSTGRIMENSYDMVTSRTIKNQQQFSIGNSTTRIGGGNASGMQLTGVVNLLKEQVETTKVMARDVKKFVDEATGKGLKIINQNPRPPTAVVG